MLCVCADMEEAFAEYKEWLGGSVDAEVEKAYNRALDTLQKIRPFEVQLVRVLWAVARIRFSTSNMVSCNTTWLHKQAAACKHCVACSGPV